MSAVRAFFVGLREAITLSNEERRAAALDEQERGPRRRHLRAARARRDAARKLASPIAAIVLLRDGLRFALAARGELEDPSDVRAALAPLAPSLSATDIDRVVALYAPASPFAVDDLPFADAETARAAFENCLAASIGALDTRSVIAIRALRVARPLALVVLLLWLIVPYVRTHYFVHNVALGKVVTSSPLRPESPTAEHVVDGITRGTFDVGTIDTEHPFVMIDLGSVYSVDHVRVINRGDGWFDDILPVVLEISEDGVRFDTLARRDEHFDTWTIPAGGKRARFVRVIKQERGYIALEEIEVYAR